MKVKLKANTRLRKSSQIQKVLEKGFLLRGKHLLLRRLPSAQVSPPLEGEGPFFAVIISRKKEKRATARNRMKRQMREIFRKQKKNIPAFMAYVVIARQALKETTYSEIEADFLNMIIKKEKE